LGKSTLINTIFASHLIETKGRFIADEPVRQTTEIQAVSHGEHCIHILLILACTTLLRCWRAKVGLRASFTSFPRITRIHLHFIITLTFANHFSLPVIVENGVKLRLNIVDTPGYGDQINNEGWYDLTRPYPNS